MKKRLVYSFTVAVISLMVFAGAETSHSEELVVKNCSELMRMAQNLQDDLKTVDTILGSAISAGNMAVIRNYKLKKAAVQKDLESVLKAIEVKSCVKNN